MLWWHEYTLHDISLCSLQIVFIAVAIFYMHTRAHTHAHPRLCSVGVACHAGWAHYAFEIYVDSISMQASVRQNMLRIRRVAH